ncbi:MAG: ACT domain-containing protein, partial [Eubacterium sp.]|nr:ACT domain-containing protein [Eubacterium sp.]
MRGIITVLGKDSVGFIGRICPYRAEAGSNSLDISQTIVGGYFNMMMIV